MASSNTNYITVLNHFEQILLQSLRIIIKLYNGLPFSVNPQKHILEKIPSDNRKRYKFLFYTSLVYFILNIMQTAIAWTQFGVGFQTFIGTYTAGTFICVCCSISSHKYVEVVCKLTNEMHRYNQNKNHHNTSFTQLQTWKTGNIYQIMMTAMLGILTCMSYLLLILFLPCLPSFVGTLFLEECQDIYTQIIPMKFINSFILKFLSSILWFLAFTINLSNVTAHLCFAVYHGYVFPFYINGYCR